jgi:hypothetical protein
VEARGAPSPVRRGEASVLRVSYGNLFVLLILVLQIGAVGAYLWQREWLTALYWTGAVVINLAVLLQASR